ncbi:uncharacterized protein LOC128962346 [Oppia nitens]|uniref:uncharacterized protein LOC128962346 n=1 Tax=Oppia nitens TaxID=1686743 RepID=UPI0023DC852D|nr:uncharacterized protein LOC128962346 [Oppia nitens]
MKQIKIIESKAQNHFIERTINKNNSTIVNLNTGIESVKDFSNEFITRRATVVLFCEPNHIFIRFNFTHPFRGEVIAGNTNSRDNRCRFRGTGQLAYELHVPHDACDTQKSIVDGLFVNKLFIRFHPSLELEGDYSKTILCKFGTGTIKVN